MCVFWAVFRTCNVCSKVKNSCFNGSLGWVNYISKKKSSKFVIQKSWSKIQKIRRVPPMVLLYKSYR